MTAGQHQTWHVLQFPLLFSSNTFEYANSSLEGEPREHRTSFKSCRCTNIYIPFIFHSLSIFHVVLEQPWTIAIKDHGNVYMSLLLFFQPSGSVKYCRALFHWLHSKRESWWQRHPVDWWTCLQLTKSDWQIQLLCGCWDQQLTSPWFSHNLSPWCVECSRRVEWRGTERYSTSPVSLFIVHLGGNTLWPVCLIKALLKSVAITLQLY